MTQQRRLNRNATAFKIIAMRKEWMETLDRMIQWENGELSDKDTTDLFGELIKNKLVWSLQGMYGRFAQSLIKAGYLTVEGEKGENYEF